MNLQLHRLLEPIKQKIFLMIGRGILKAIKNSEKTMKIQVVGLSGETITDIERLQEYGFEAYPKTGSAEAVIGFINGNRDQGIVLTIADREYRPTDLAEGEVRVYDWQGNKITCKSGGYIEVFGKNGTAAVEKSMLGETFKTLFDSCLDGIVAITVPSPLGPLGPIVNSATFTAIKAQTPTMLSNGVKNN